MSESIDQVPQDHPDDLARTARGHLSRNELNEAADLLDDALERHPAHTGLLLAASDVALRQKDLSRALSYARTATDHSPADNMAKFVLAGVYKQTGDLDAADSILHAILETAPNDVSVMRRLSEVAGKRNDLATAIEYARRVVAVQNAALNYSSLCSLLMQQGDYAEAEQVTRSGLEAFPGNAPLESRLIDLLARRGEVSAAIELAERALAGKPDDAALQRQLYTLLVRNNDLEAAGRVVQAGLDADPQNETLLARATDISARLGRFGDMFHYAEAILAKRPDAQVYRNLAATHSSYGNFEAAEKALAAARQAAPDDIGGWRRSAEIAVRRGDLEAAAAFLLDAIRRKPDYAELYDDLASIHMQQGDFAKALATTEDGLRQVPGHSGLTRRQAYLQALPPSERPAPAPKPIAERPAQQPEPTRPRGIFGLFGGRS